MKPSRKRRDAGGAGNGAAKAEAAAAPPAARLAAPSRFRRIAFRLAALLAPWFLLLCVEVALRAVGYGYPTRFFRPTTVGDRAVLVENEKFAWRFFPPEIARSVFQPSSDLYLMDLSTRSYTRLDISSPRSDSWHSWSSNSRWIVFASKRLDGTFARLYFSFVDERGRVHKPVLLPQKDPTFYDRFLKTYNAPELARAPAPATQRALAEAICQRKLSTNPNPPGEDD